MTAINADEIRQHIQLRLSGTPYECKELIHLSGGTANFLYKGILFKPLEDGASQVAVKHSEAFVKTNPEFSLTIERSHFEKIALERVQMGLDPVEIGPFIVKTPKLLYYDRDTNTQVYEYCSNSIDAKTYALQFWSPTPTEAQEQCVILGKSLGSWLRQFHNWADSPEQEAFRAIVAQNTSMQRVKNIINYSNSLNMAQKHPEILGDTIDVLQAIAVMATEEKETSFNFGVIHGDFWTGNVILPQIALDNKYHIPVNIIDWELVQIGPRAMDLGQMIAELYELKLFKDIDAGTWMMKGLMFGYGTINTKMAFRTAIHIGSHLINFSSVPDWGSEEQVKRVIKQGRDIVSRAWRKDREWFEGTPLNFLFEARKDE